MKNRLNWCYSLFYISCLLLFLGSVTGYSQTTFQQQNQSYNQNQNSYGGFGSNQSYNANQYQGQQLNSGFGSSRSSRGSLSGRSRSSRSSRRGNDTTNFTNAIPGTTAPTQSVRPSISRRPNTPSGLAPSNAGGGGAGGISVHSGSGNNADVKKPANRQSVPQPQIKKKTYLYLESSHLSAKVGEPFTIDVRLSGLADTQFDSLAFQLRYNPLDLMPVQGQGSEGEWLPANSVQFMSNSNSAKDDGPFLFSDSTLVQQTNIQHPVQHTAGTISFSANLAETVRAKNFVLARMTFVPIRHVKSTRISFDTGLQSNETNTSSTYLFFEGKDVLGSENDPFDGVIPLDITIQPDANSSKHSIAWMNEEPKPRHANARLELVVPNGNVNIGDSFDLQIVLNNPAQIPVDEVEFLIGYNTRVLQMVSSDSVGNNGLSGGLQINKEKGIMQYKQAIRKTTPDTQTVIATVRFQAIRPTTNTTFKVLVHKDGSMPSTGASYKGQDILGESGSPTDGIHTTSVSVRPTLAYLQQKTNSF